jgi:hypothetical protein
MPRLMTALLAATFLLPAARAREPVGGLEDAAMKLARQLTEKGATTFDTKDAQAMTDFYLEEAEISLVTKGRDGYSVKVYRGKVEIESLYRDIFKNPEGVKSKNEVEFARLVRPDILAIFGTFEIQRGSQTARFPFFQERIKKDDRWLISSLRFFAVPE